jgi:hypothetical protein
VRGPVNVSEQQAQVLLIEAGGTVDSAWAGGELTVEEIEI